MKVEGVLSRTNWPELLEQKQCLIEVIASRGQKDDPLDGLLNWIDALQDAAEFEGFPVPAKSTWLIF